MSANQIQQILKNINLFVDGRGYAGQVESYDPPKLTLKTENYRPGGRDVEVKIDQGMEPLDAKFVLIGFNSEVLKLWGVVANKEVPLTMRAAMEDEDGAVTPVIINLRGKLLEVDSGTWKPGEAAKLNITLNAHYYKLNMGGIDVHEIDVRNMVRMINGVDSLAEQRAALGI